MTASLGATTQRRSQGLIQPKMTGPGLLWKSHGHISLEEEEAIRGGFLKEESSEQNGRLAKQRELRIL